MDLIRTVEGLREQVNLDRRPEPSVPTDEVRSLHRAGSHLAKHSMILRPPRRRAVVQQPEHEGSVLDPSNRFKPSQRGTRKVS